MARPGRGSPEGNKMGVQLHTLIVEDSEDDTLLIVCELKHGGYEPAYERVETAGAMRSALGRQAWDVVISDYTLPQFSALAALQVLKESGRDLPFIIVSGAIGEETAVAAMKAGAHDYVMKNNLGRLIAVIERELHESRVRLERKKVQESLEQITLRNELILNSVEEGILGLDLQGIHTFSNPSAARMLGYEVEELIGKPSHSVWHHSKADGSPYPEEKCPIYAAFKDGTVDHLMEEVFWRKDKTSFPVEYTSTPIRENGEIVGAVVTFKDISERRRAEEALPESEERFRLAAESSADLIYEWDIKERVDWYGKIDELLGYAPSEFPRTLEAWANSVHADDRDRVMAAVRNHLEKNESYNIEYRVRKKDGTYNYWWVRGRAVRNEKGNPYRWIGAVTDITERKRTEEALRSSEKKYRTLIQNLPQKIFLKDKNSIYISCNENYAKDLKIKPEEMSGRTDYDFYPKELAEKYRADDRRIAEIGKTEELEEKYIQNGQEVWVNTIKTPVKDEKGNLIAILGIFWDITERKRTAEALRASEERYRALFEAAAEGILVADVERRQFKHANPAICRMLGYTAEELTRLNVADIHPKEALNHVVAEFEAQARGEKSLSAQIPCLRKDGSVIYVDIATAPVVIDGRKCNVGFFTDITERKRAEEALGEALEQAAWLARFPEENPSPVVRVSAEGSVLYRNRAAAELPGWACEVGKPLLDPLLPLVGQVMTGGQGAQLDVDLGGRFYSVAVTPFLEERYANIYGRDIMERKDAEVALRESEKRYRQVIEDAAEVIYTTDAKGNFTYGNSAGLKITGYSLEELQRLNYLDLVLPEHRQKVTDNYARQFRERRSTSYIEFPFLCKSGKVIWFGQNASMVIEDGKVAGFHIIARDITERKRAEQALFDSEQRYRNLVENAPDVIFTLSPDGTITSLNPAFETITGWPRSDWLYKQFASILHPDDLSQGLEFFQRFLKWERIAPFPLRVPRKSGDYLVAEFTVAPQTQNGSVTSILGIARDITERKRAEEALREQRQLLDNILNSIPTPVFYKDIKGAYLGCNSAYLDFMGLPRERVIGKTIAEFAPAGLAEIYLKSDQHLINTGGSHAYEVAFPFADGSIHEVMTHKALFRNVEGAISGIVGVIFDISERKRAEEALGESEKAAQRLAQENAVMAEIGRIISSTLNIEEVYERFAAEVGKLIPFDRIMVALNNLEEGTATVTYASGSGFEGRGIGNVYPLRHSGNEEVMRTREGLLVQPEAVEELEGRFSTLIPTFQAGLRSMMSVPLISRDQVIGALHLRSKKAKAYTDRDLRLAERIAPRSPGPLPTPSSFLSAKKWKPPCRRPIAAWKTSSSSFPTQPSSSIVTEK